MGLNEADTRAKLVDPAIHKRGWTEDLIRREETSGAIEIIDGKPQKRSRGRVDYVLRVKVNPLAQPVALALIEAKAEDLPPMHGLEQAKPLADITKTRLFGLSWKKWQGVKRRPSRKGLCYLSPPAPARPS